MQSSEEFAVRPEQRAAAPAQPLGSADRPYGVDLYWLPLGAGGNFVRLNGRIYEAIKARLDRRKPCDLYHSGLEVVVPEGRFVIEMTPVYDGNGRDRGVVAEGAVGGRWAGRFRIFRYELRRWKDGSIPDVDEAVDSPQALSDDIEEARRVLQLAAQVPTLVWGRDEAKAGEMWNSNSLISWMLEQAGLITDAVRPPAGGRAPGWDAGIVVAHRHTAAAVA
jgi:hypothetical protein